MDNRDSIDRYQLNGMIRAKQSGTCRVNNSEFEGTVYWGGGAMGSDFKGKSRGDHRGEVPHVLISVAKAAKTTTSIPTLKIGLVTRVPMKVSSNPSTVTDSRSPH